jgi:glutathione S-transferase
MPDLILHTLDWVPDFPRGYVRDLRIRWALEEAGLPYRVATTPLRGKTPEHFAHQPFGQVPWITQGEVSIFETGAILLHLGAQSEALLPRDPKARLLATEWLFAALNSVEAAVLPWSIFASQELPADTPVWNRLVDFLNARLTHLEPVLARRDWLAGSFSVADILMADVLRLVDRFGALADYPAAKSYLARAKARPAFQKALADQLAHFAAADQAAR